MNIFEQATKKKLRFATERGAITTEHLWDLPLRSKNGFDLDTIAKGINAKIKETAVESFVDEVPSGEGSDLELALEVVKHIIAIKLEAGKKAAQAASNREEARRINEELHARGNEALKAMSTEELQARAKELAGSY